LAGIGGEPAVRARVGGEGGKGEREENSRKSNDAKFFELNLDLSFHAATLPERTLRKREAGKYYFVPEKDYPCSV